MMNVKRRRSSDVDDESSNGVIETRCWSDLQSELLEPIMSKLFYADQINFRAVCKSWHSLDRVPPLKQMPWFMVFDDEEGKNSCKLVDPTYKKTYTIDMSSINKKKNLKDCRVKIHESKKGWLLMSCVSSKTPTSTQSLFLYSPFFIDNNIIELPVLDTRYLGATFDLNLTKYGKEDFEVLVLSLYTDRIRIGTCRPGDNTWSWKKPLLEYSIFEKGNWVYSEGIIYYAHYFTRASGSYDIVRNKWTKFPAFLSASGSYDIVRNKWTKFPAFLQEGSSIDNVMVKLDSEIFLINITKKMSYCWGSMNGSLYKLDASKGTWESIPSLGDRALFLGDEYSLSLELDDDDIDELKDQKQKVYYCYGSVLKHCNGLGETSSRSCSKHYGSLGRGKLFCKRIWIDPPRRPHFTNSL